MSDITWRDRLRYRFDNLMARGVIALMGWLFLLTVFLIFAATLLAAATDSKPSSDNGDTANFLETLWLSFVHIIDTGTIAEDNTGNPFFVFLMLMVTFGGIFIFSALIGVITAGLEDRLDELRKGRSIVLEHDHIIILGWSTEIFSIIQQLILANVNQKTSCIVIMGNKDKVEMEDEVRARVGRTGHTKIVVRTGDPIDMADLAIVRPEAARSIIILSDESSDPDSHVIKTILALTNTPERRAAPYHIVAEIQNPRNLSVAQMIAPDKTEVLPVSDLVSRIAVQTSRQSGLSVVYLELLDFSGSEIYFTDQPRMAGKTFGDAIMAYENAALIGIRDHNHRIKVNPGMDYIIGEGDTLILIALDDHQMPISERQHYPIDHDLIVDVPTKPALPEKTLVLGWNHRAPFIIRELDGYVASGSSLTVAAEGDDIDTTIERENGRIKNQTIHVVHANITDRDALDALDIATYNHVIVLSYSDTLSEQDADAHTLITLLHLRDIAERHGANFTIVSEMLDVRNRELAEITRADDFIVSDKLISLMISQIATNRDLVEVLMDIFDPHGSEIYLKPVGEYVRLGVPVNMHTLFDAARRKGQIAIGYRIISEQKQSGYGVYVNPPKTGTAIFSAGDKIIVVSEN